MLFYVSLVLSSLILTDPTFSLLVLIIYFLIFAFFYLLHFFCSLVFSRSGHPLNLWFVFIYFLYHQLFIFFL